MSLVSLLTAATERNLTDPGGAKVRIELRPGMDDAGIGRLRARYPVPLPIELVEALRRSAGAGELLGLDLTGESHSVEAEALLPAGHPVAADGVGNFCCST